MRVHGWLRVERGTRDGECCCEGIQVVVCREADKGCECCYEGVRVVLCGMRQDAPVMSRRYPGCCVWRLVQGLLSF